MRDRADDEELAALALAGDTSAFESLVSRFRDRLADRVRDRLPVVLRPRLSASDVVQECLLVAHRRLPDFEDRGPGSLGRWLQGIVDYKVRDEVRNHLVRARRDAGRDVRLGSGSHANEFTDLAPSPGTRVVVREEHAAVRAALDTLSEPHREVLRLVHEAGLTVPEAAEHMGRSPEATRKLYARAVADLARAVRPRRGESP